MSEYTLALQDVDKTMLPFVGGKGAHLGELCKLQGIHVPDGFCLTVDAFQVALDNEAALTEKLERLSLLQAEEDRRARYELGADIRSTIESIFVPDDIVEEIDQQLARMGSLRYNAVRSSATAEDLPTASFAGQHDSFLNVSGKAAILKHIRSCWASLFTDRAIEYRLQNGFSHHEVRLAVIVQQMVSPHAAGTMFTADPVTSNRKVVAIEAVRGLGEDLVSGLVNSDHYSVRSGSIVNADIAASAKRHEASLAPNHRSGATDKQILSDAQIVQLEQIGRKIEAHFGCPQDIEWCLADNSFYIVQSRPITTLYPIPEADDCTWRVYVSVGHQQMMTDPMKPLGLSFYLMTTPAPMRTAGGRLFVDVTNQLATPTGQEQLLNTLGQSDPLIKDALMTIIERNPNMRKPPQEQTQTGKVPPPPSDPDPDDVSALIHRSQLLLRQAKRQARTKSGHELIDWIREDVRRLTDMMFDPQSLGVIMAAMGAYAWMNEHIQEWLGEPNAADAISQSISHNITSDMGLKLLVVADVIRPYPEVIQALQQAKDDRFLEELDQWDGGREASEAIRDFLNKYGMRCPGEIDVTRPRWSEQPSALIPVILSHIRQFEPGESSRRRTQGRQVAWQKEQSLLTRLKQLADGEQKAMEAKRNIDIIRNFAGYREYPKYAMMCRYFVYRQALLREAERLVQAGVLSDTGQIDYLTFDELREVVRTDQLDERIINERKAEFETFKKWNPPRVITSDGETIEGEYRRHDLPAGAIPGLPVSSGLVEGRARVVRELVEAKLEEGDILVTTFTDPSWTPLFVSIKGLVTEVGGRMTHGAVIAREYGLPAVVGVEHATGMIRDGQRIRVNGSEGWIELL